MNVTANDYQPLSRWDALLCLALSGLTLALFFFFLAPPFPSDQLDYFYHAWRTDDLRPNHRHLRIGLILPVWLMIQLFGYSELSYYAIPAFGTLSLTLGTWFVGRMLFDRWVGALSAILVIYNPWVLTSVTDLLPDYLGAGLCAVALGILLWYWRTDRLTGQARRPMASVLLFVAGLLIGWSYLTREYVVITFPVAIFIILAVKDRVAAFVAVALGAAVCWFLELTWGFIKYGDPLARLHAVASPRAVDRFVETNAIDIFLQLPDILMGRSGGLLFVFLLLCGMGVCVWRSIRGDRRWRLLTLWLVGGWLFFTTVALLPVILLGEEHVYLRMQKFRYWALILPPTMIAGVAGSQQLCAYLARWADPGGTRHASSWVFGSAVAVALLWASFAVFSESYSGLVRGGMNDYAQFRKFIEQIDNAEEIVFLEQGRRSLPIYLATWSGGNSVWKGRVVQTSIRKLDEIIRKPGKRLVAIDLTRAETLRRKGKSPDELLRRLDQSGEKLFESSGGRVVVYRLDDQ